MKASDSFPTFRNAMAATFGSREKLKALFIASIGTLVGFVISGYIWFLLGVVTGQTAICGSWAPDWWEHVWHWLALGVFVLALLSGALSYRWYRNRIRQSSVRAPQPNQSAKPTPPMGG